MGERDKEMPGSCHKRSSDSLEEQNPDIANKRLRLEMESGKEDRQNERRQKNKEAAEKSRRKKKEEFSKIQTENDQLQQDKCQLVAAIEGLKTDLSKVTKENNALRYKIDHLKRWIGKHARDLGLGKHMQRNLTHEERTEGRKQDRSRDDLLWGDPSLYSTTVGADQEQDYLLDSTSAPVSYSSSAPMSFSSSPFISSSSAPSVSSSSVPVSSTSSAPISSSSSAPSISSSSAPSISSSSAPSISSSSAPSISSSSAPSISSSSAPSISSSSAPSISSSSAPSISSSSAPSISSSSAPVSSFSSTSISSSFAIPSLPSQPLATSVAASKSESHEHFFLPVGVRTVNFSAECQLPLAVENISSNTEGQREAELSPGQRIVYLTKDTVIMVNGECGPQLMMAAPNVQEEVRLNATHVHQVHEVSSCEQQTSVQTSEQGTISMEVQSKSAEAPRVMEIGIKVVSPRKKSVESTKVQEAAVEVTTVQETSVQGPDEPHTTVAARNTVLVDSPENSVVAKNTTESTKNESTLPDASASNQLSLASTIDALLKMGYSIQLPDGAQIEPGSSITLAGKDV